MENPVIQIQNLKKSFNHQEVLKGIDLEVNAGEVIGYLGSNGAGKSTTVKILCGVIRDFEGDIRILGHDLRQEDITIKKRIVTSRKMQLCMNNLLPWNISNLQPVSTGSLRILPARKALTY